MRPSFASTTTTPPHTHEWTFFGKTQKTLESLEPEELRNARYAMFGQCVVDLIGVLLVLMRYPEDVEQLSDDEVGFNEERGGGGGPRLLNESLAS